MKYIILLISTITFFAGSAQERTVSGRLTDSSGDPLPGINIVEKGTTHGTITDFDGNYTITVPIGATLVFSGIGFQTKEIIVGKLTESSNVQQGDGRFPVKRQIKDSAPTEPGIASFDHQSKTFESYAPLDILRLHRIKERGKKYILKSYSDPVHARGFGLQYSQVLGFSHVTQLPKLQSSYAQGRSDQGELSWFGADSNEFFSWGPKLSNLEYDNGDYPFDRNGPLVSLGSSNGNEANRYRNDKIFQKGWINKHDFLFTKPVGSGDIRTSFNYTNEAGVIPTSKKESVKMEIQGESLSFGEKSGDLSIQSFFVKNEGSLLSHGANIARIYGDALNTPVSFDNKNGFSRKVAIQEPSAWQLDNESLRSFAPSEANNPFGLVASSPDMDVQSRYFVAIGHHWKRSFSLNHHLDINSSLSHDRQKLESQFGIPSGFPVGFTGVLTNRATESNQTELRITPAFKWYKTGYERQLTLDYQFSSSRQKLHRTDQQGFDSQFDDPDVTRLSNASLSRNTHQIAASGKVKWPGNYITYLGNTLYVSSTAGTVAFNPFVAFVAHLNFYPFTISPKISYSKSTHEASLLYNDWSYASINLNSGQFRQVYEANDLMFPDGLKPETKRKLQFDIETRLWWLGVDFGYSYEIVDDFIAPASLGNLFSMQNVGRVDTESLNVRAFFQDYFWPGNRWKIALSWTRNVPIVKSISSQQEIIPLAGFGNAQSVMAENQPMGMIYGTAYARDPSGAIIIGNDGFPLVAADIHPLANPNPQGVCGFDGMINVKNLSLNLLMEYNYGREVWNGTQAYLDYLGRSAKTEIERTTVNHIFEGVSESGDRNTIPVNFYDPALDVTENRWVRYGPEGIAASYIESVYSWRLSELIFSYSFRFTRSHPINSITISMIGRNLLQITPYQGVDPESDLFGYGYGAGLDMFNLPSTRGYQLKMMIKL